MKFGIRGQLTDVITCVKFLVDRFRGYGVLTPPKLPFHIDLLHRPTTVYALPRDTVVRGLAAGWCPVSTATISTILRFLVNAKAYAILVCRSAVFYPQSRPLSIWGKLKTVGGRLPNEARSSTE